ncbi:hypothetical protein ACFV3F_33045, partial [Streptomyces sp. NPDC059717]|uniref:hypothetical protein n=1 Tax=Streptomyces sp. NPDC059717 TaxID=3346922 RepID=UPI00368D47D2
SPAATSPKAAWTRSIRPKINPTRLHHYRGHDQKENAELKRANEILKAAASFFAAELDRPHTRS